MGPGIALKVTALNALLTVFVASLPMRRRRARGLLEPDIPPMHNAILPTDCSYLTRYRDCAGRILFTRARREYPAVFVVIHLSGQETSVSHPR